MYSDQKMENQMGSLLRAGVILSCLIMLAGGILYVMRHGAEHEAYSIFHGEPAALESIGGILREVRAGSARGVIQLSVLTMIATPVMRVAFAVYGFSRQRQWVFTAISLTVLLLLAFGLSERG
ncbi:MAG TPA: DUF1634 domain-containing protein [Bryobacteraceae bacterium]|jgi:uncharacterized membrane protein|nr:DUF1634 domain-containing protein [Bryobacteraceae bacterium]